MFHFIDDEPMLREILQAFISAAGYDSIGFESGQQYIEYLKSPEFESPTAILSDVTMPGINGYDLVLEIRKLHPLQKIILITGNADDEHHALAASQLCYRLDKPYKPKKLIALLHALVACEKAHKTGSLIEYFNQCEFGIEHECPFYELNTNQLRQ